MGVTIRTAIEEEVLARAVEALEGTDVTVEEVLAQRLRELAGEGAVPPGHAPASPEDYDRWFRARVQEALDDPRPPSPHDDVMAELDRLLDEADRGRS